MKRIRYLIGALLVFALVAAACGDDDGAETPESEPAAETTSSALDAEDVTTTTEAPTTTTIAPDSTASEPEPEPTLGCTTESPGAVKIGYLGLPLPGNDELFAAGVDYVNDELGGFCGGNTFEVVTCMSLFTPESTVDCLNQFIAEDVVVATGLTLLFVNPNDLTSARLASFGAAPGSVPEAESVESSTHFFPPSTACRGAPIAAMGDLGFENGGVFFTDNASGQSSAETAAELADGLGVSITPTFFAAAPEVPDWAAKMLTAVASGPDFVGAQILSAPGDCPGFISAAINTPNTPPFLAASCAVDAIANAADIAGNYIYSFTILPGDEANAPTDQVANEVGIYRNAVADLPNAPFGGEFGSARDVFGTAINLARAIESLPITEITGDTVYDNLPSAAFDVFMAGPVDCAARPDAGQTGCGTNMWLYEIVADGTFINRGLLPVLQ